MKIDIHIPKNPLLSKYIEKITYGKGCGNFPQITSYSNTNICLGILRNCKLNKINNIHHIESYNGLYSYLSGLYLEPHHIFQNSFTDYIAIDFTPIGYYQFFSLPAKKYILDSDILLETFGVEGKDFMQRVFETDEITLKSNMIEHFLLRKITFNDANIFLVLDLLQKNWKIEEISFYLKISSRKIQMDFKKYFDISPKEFQRIYRFRNTLRLLTNKSFSLTQIGLDCHYYDQSHFIKEFQFFTDKSPKHLLQNLYSKDDQFIISLR